MAPDETTTPSTSTETPDKNPTPDTAEPPMFLVVARLKDYISKAGLRTGTDFLMEFNQEVMRLVDRSITRCTQSGRKTLNGSDA